MIRYIISIFLIVSSSLSLIAQDYQTAKKVVKLMGCRFEITAIAATDSIAWESVEIGIKEIQRIEDLISSWDLSSETSRINDAAGIEAVVVDVELYNLIYRSKKVSKLTNGAFDISFASMEWIWNFDGQEHEMPDSLVVENASKLIDWESIILDDKNKSVYLDKNNMKIGFGAIGKGYAANMAKEKMSELEGVVGGLVNASGDLLAWGVNIDSEYWSIQIADPINKNRAIGWLELKDMAIVTSGDYEKYFSNNGIRYAHIIDPRTGYPTTGIKSVTVVCPDAELADALATSVFVLGAESGIELINGLNQIECIVIDNENNILTSENLKLNYYE